MTEHIERRISWQHLTGAIALVVLVIVLIVQVADGNGAGGGDRDYGDPSTPGVPRSEAWHDCKRAVTDALANPSTANFALLSTDFAEQPGGGWSITGTVTAENAFGVEREMGYACEVSPSGAVDATVS